MLNIGAANADDAFYRYKMPPIQSKIEGRGNGIKTNVVNMVEVAKALARPASYTTKFFGCVALSLLAKLSSLRTAALPRPQPPLSRQQQTGPRCCSKGAWWCADIPSPIHRRGAPARARNSRFAADRRFKRRDRLMVLEVRDVLGACFRGVKCVNGGASRAMLEQENSGW
jgi:hypothetical protein